MELTCVYSDAKKRSGLKPERFAYVQRVLSVNRYF
jgi:hypothetical protein